MKLTSLIKDIDSIEISGYPVREENVIKKCELIQRGLNRLNNGGESADSIKEFIKRIYWFGFELGHSKGLESSKYVGEQVSFMKEAQRIEPKVYGEIVNS